MQPKISVIIPCYNTAKYLKRCLESLIKQTLKEIEIICINDGSTDNSIEILKEYAILDNRIKILTQDNQGQSVARNKGLDIATGEYIGFVDSDDWIDLNYYEELYNTAQKYHSDVVMCNFVCIKNDKIKTNSVARNKVYTSFKDKMNILPNGTCCDKIFRTEIIKAKKIYFPINIFYEDNLFLIEAIYYSKNLTTTNKTKYHYWINNESTTQAFQNIEKLKKSLVVLTNKIFDFVRDKNLSKTDINILKKYISIAFINPEFLEDEDVRNNLPQELKNDKKIMNLGKGIKYNNLGERIFSMKNSGDRKHKIITICGISIKIRRQNKRKYIIKKFWQHEVANKTVLIIEANDCHKETILGYMKYFVDLGYNIELLINGQSENILCKINSNIKVWELRSSELEDILQNEKIKKYEILFFNSKIIYTPSGWLDIHKYIPQLKQGKMKNIYVQHHIDRINEVKEDTQLILANPSHNKELEKHIVNPHYFGNINITDKNLITNFIVVGGIEAQRKNHNLLINTIEKLLSNNITNFKITIVGNGTLNTLPLKIKNKIDIKGRLDFMNMFKEMENADFFLPLLDPNLEAHKRYMTCGSSGSFQLIYGFLKPCLIHQTFANIYNFTDNDSLIYQTNEGLFQIMKQAIDMNQDEYKEKQKYLENHVNFIENLSLCNLNKKGHL